MAQFSVPALETSWHEPSLLPVIFPSCAAGCQDNDFIKGILCLVPHRCQSIRKDSVCSQQPSSWLSPLCPPASGAWGLTWRAEQASPEDKRAHLHRSRHQGGHPPRGLMTELEVARRPCTKWVLQPRLPLHPHPWVELVAGVRPLSEGSSPVCAEVPPGEQRAHSPLERRCGALGPGLSHTVSISSCPAEKAERGWQREHWGWGWR